MARLRDASVWKLKESTVLHDVTGAHSQYADAAQCAAAMSTAAGLLGVGVKTCPGCELVSVAVGWSA